MDRLPGSTSPQFSPTTGIPAKPVRLAFGALFIKQRLGLTDEETMEQIRENSYIQFFLGYASYASKASLDPSMMVDFRQRFSEEDLSRFNELITERGKAMVIEAIARIPDDDESDDPDDDAGNQLSLVNFVKPADWLEGKPWGILTVDASCTPADITYPTDFKLLNQAKESTERIIEDLCEEYSDFRKHKPRYYWGKARAVFSVLPNRRNHAAARLKPQYIASSTICSGILKPSIP
jgi:IS5 family transposase